MNITKWPDAERVKRKAPLLFLIAIALWGATLVHVAVASRSWPSRGVAGSLSLTCSRPPVSDKTMDSSDAQLDAMFLRIVEKEFAGETDALLGGTGLPAEENWYAPNRNWSGSEQNNPLRKTWTVAAAATSADCIEYPADEGGGGIDRVAAGECSRYDHCRFPNRHLFTEILEAGFVQG